MTCPTCVQFTRSRLCEDRNAREIGERRVHQVVVVTGARDAGVRVEAHQDGIRELPRARPERLGTRASRPGVLEPVEARHAGRRRARPPRGCAITCLRRQRERQEHQGEHARAAGASASGGYALTCWSGGRKWILTARAVGCQRPATPHSSPPGCTQGVERSSASLPRRAEHVNTVKVSLRIASPWQGGTSTQDPVRILLLLQEQTRKRRRRMVCDAAFGISVRGVGLRGVGTSDLTLIRRAL